MKRAIGLVAIDLDGTLVDSDTLEIAARDRDAIRAVADRGVHVVIATARTPGVAMQFARELGLSSPVIGNNGASAALLDGTELVRKTIPAECALRIVQAIPAESRVSWVEWDRICVEERAGGLPSGKRKVNFWEWEVEVVPRSGFPVSSGASAIGAFGGPVDGLVSAVSSEPVCALRYFSSGALSGVIFIDAEASKGNALLKVAEHLGVPRDAVLAIGDSEADVPMFTAAGLSVAMADAPEDIRARASWVAPPQSEQGVAAALTHFVLAA